MIIGSHQRFWQCDKEKYAWIDYEMLEIRKDFLPDYPTPISNKFGINECVVEQADQNKKENDFYWKRLRIMTLKKKY